ncbi:hypothetical protein PENSPDRAFT_657241 [Peniophora sp. CONT]|nr:hypothetical protein PENSPDRAFT_657241 [Peniophora sp. CONT]
MPRKKAAAKPNAPPAPEPSAASAPAVPPPPPPPPPPASGAIDFASLDTGTGKLTDAEKRKRKRARETPAQKKAAPKTVDGHSRPAVVPQTLKGHKRVNRRYDEFRPYFVAYGELDNDSDDDDDESEADADAESSPPRPERQLPPDLFDPDLPENKDRVPPTRTPNFLELKHFALFLCRTVEGRRILNANGDKVGVPSIDTIKAEMKTVISLWQRYHAMPVPTGDRNELYDYLDSSEFLDLAFTTTLEVEKHDISLEDLKTLITLMLTNPELVRTKHALLNVQLALSYMRFLGGRVGEYVESAGHFGSGHAPRYGDEVKFFAVPSVKDQESAPLLAVQLAAPWLKGHRADESVKKVVFLVADSTFDPLFDPVSGSFSRAFDDDVFTHFRSMDQLQKARIRQWTELTIKPEWLGKFFLRADVQQGHEVTTSLDIPYRYHHLIPIWRELVRLAGFDPSLVPHNCRLAVSGEVFGSVGQYEQMRINHHENPESHANAYMTQTVTSDLVGIVHGLPQRPEFAGLARFFDSATRTRLRNGIGPLSVAEKLQLVEHHPAIRAQIEELKAIKSDAGRADELWKAKMDYKRMFRSASLAFREAKRRQGLLTQADEDQRVMFAPGSSSDSDATLANKDLPPLDYPNEYVRVAYAPHICALEYPMERYALLTNAFLSIPRLTRLSVFSEGLIPLTGANCPDCQRKLPTRLEATLHAASCQSASKLSEVRSLLPDDEWQARSCTTCQRKPRAKNRDTVFNTRDDFCDHVRDIHLPKKACCFCDATFPSRDEFEFHLALEHSFNFDGGFAEYRHARRQWLVAPNGLTEDVCTALRLERDERFPHRRREDAVQLDLTHVKSSEAAVAAKSRRPIIVIDGLFSWGTTLPDYHERSSSTALLNLATCLFCEADHAPAMLYKGMKQYQRNNQAEHVWYAHLNHLSKDAVHLCPCSDCGAQEFTHDELVSHLILVHFVPLHGSAVHADRQGIPRQARALYTEPAPSSTASSQPGEQSTTGSGAKGICAGCGFAYSVARFDDHLLNAGPESLCAHRAAYRIRKTKDWIEWKVPAHLETVSRPLPGTEAYVCGAVVTRKDLNLPASAPKPPRCNTACIDLDNHNCKYPHVTRYFSFQSGTNKITLHETRPTEKREAVRPRHTCACGAIAYDIRVHLNEVEASPESFDHKDAYPRFAHTHTEFFTGPDDEQPVAVNEWLVDPPVAPFLVRCAESSCGLVFARWSDHANTNAPNISPSYITTFPNRDLTGSSCSANKFYVLDEDATWSSRIYAVEELQALTIPASRVLHPQAIRWPASTSPTQNTSSAPSSPLTPMPLSPALSHTPLSPLALAPQLTLPPASVLPRSQHDSPRSPTPTSHTPLSPREPQLTLPPAPVLPVTPASFSFAPATSGIGDFAPSSSDGWAMRGDAWEELPAGLLTPITPSMSTVWGARHYEDQLDIWGVGGNSLLSSSGGVGGATDASAEPTSSSHGEPLDAPAALLTPITPSTSFAAGWGSSATQDRRDDVEGSPSKRLRLG